MDATKMKLKIHPTLVLEFSSPWIRHLVFQILGSVRSTIISIFTFFVAVTGGFNDDPLINRPIVSTAEYLYYPVYHINRILPGYFDSFYINAVPCPLGFSNHALICDADFSFPGFSRFSDACSYMLSPTSREFRAHLKYSIPIYLLFFNIFSFSFIYLKRLFRKRKTV